MPNWPCAPSAGEIFSIQFLRRTENKINCLAMYSHFCVSPKFSQKTTQNCYKQEVTSFLSLIQAFCVVLWQPRWGLSDTHSKVCKSSSNLFHLRKWWEKLLSRCKLHDLLWKDKKSWLYSCKQPGLFVFDLQKICPPHKLQQVECRCNSPPLIFWHFWCSWLWGKGEILSQNVWESAWAYFTKTSSNVDKITIHSFETYVSVIKYCTCYSNFWLWSQARMVQYPRVCNIHKARPDCDSLAGP